MLISNHEAIVKEAIKCLPHIFEYYGSHDYLKKHDSLLLSIYSKLEDRSSNDIKAHCLRALNKLLANMSNNSYSMVNKVAIKFGVQQSKTPYLGLIYCLGAKS
jgi:hypothetical protein